MASYSNESFSFKREWPILHPTSLCCTSFWWKERGKQQALIWMKNSHLKRTLQYVSLGFSGKNNNFTLELWQLLTPWKIWWNIIDMARMLVVGWLSGCKGGEDKPEVGLLCYYSSWWWWCWPVVFQEPLVWLLLLRDVRGVTSGHGEVVGRPVVTAVLRWRQTGQMVEGEFSERRISWAFSFFSFYYHGFWGYRIFSVKYYVRFISCSKLHFQA